MSSRNEDILAESTPVVDLRKHALDGPDNFSANDPLETWDNDKTEVYVDSDGDDSSAQLIGEDGENYPISAFPYVIGRGTECDLVLNGKGISRKHAEVVFQSGRFVINDLQSLNGIKVNGYKVNRVILEEGDTIKLGEASLTFSSGKDDIPSGKKKSLFNKKAQLDTPTDDTFGKSSGTYIKLASTVVFVMVACYAGWFFYQNQGSSAQVTAGGIIDQPPKQEFRPTQKQTSNHVAAGQAAQQQTKSQTASMQVNAKNKAAVIGNNPPPSLASLPAVTKSKMPVNQSVSKPDLAKPAAAPIKTKPTKPKISREEVAAKRLLGSADSKYLAGDAESLFSTMNRMENNSKVTSSLRNRLKNKHEKLARLYSEYTAGKQAFVSGDKDKAFDSWARFLEREKSLFGDKRKSVYADQVSVKVVEEYVAKGNEAAKAGDKLKAYELWQKALSLGESVAAKIAIDNADARARQLYRKALRLEYVNSQKAKDLWQEVTQMVPPGSEYHTKASSKLAWYNRWGA